MVSRRSFIQAMAASAALPLPSSARALAGSTADRRIALQLYTVLAPLAQDFVGTLRAVAAMGYRQVESIGAFGKDPKYVRDAFDACGLKSFSQHMTPDGLFEQFQAFMLKRISGPELTAAYLEKLNPDRVEPVIEQGIAIAKTLSQTYLVWPIVWNQQIASVALMDHLAAAYNKAGEMCRKEGLVFAYHNHAREFEPVDGVVPYDHLVEHTDPALVKLEMDYFWMGAAKRSPADYFKRYPGRYKMVHLKDRDAAGNGADVGSGVLDMRTMIEAGRKAGVEHFIVEGDMVADPIQMARNSYAFLHSLRW